MKWFLLGLLLLACIAAVGRDSGEHPIPMPYEAPAAWTYVQRCSGLTNDSLSPTTVHWIAAPLIEHDRFHAQIGEWLPPDTIKLDTSRVNDPVLIAHELLHHLLRGPPRPYPAHPIMYFVVLCHLMALPVGG